MLDPKPELRLAADKSQDLPISFQQNYYYYIQGKLETLREMILTAANPGVFLQSLLLIIRFISVSALMLNGIAGMIMLGKSILKAVNKSRYKGHLICLVPERLGEAGFD